MTTTKSNIFCTYSICSLFRQLCTRREEATRSVQNEPTKKLHLLIDQSEKTSVMMSQPENHVTKATEI